jgi:hypothetical protein
MVFNLIVKNVKKLGQIRGKKKNLNTLDVGENQKQE